jgi:hypothetical protein
VKSHIFWTLTCLLIAVTTTLFSGWVPAAPAPVKPRKIAKPIIKLGKASKVLVRIGDPYICEMKSGKR